jgi:hypothetical protein
LEVAHELLLLKGQERQPSFFRQGEMMTRREALGVLMMSPIYYRLPLAARKVLLDEFCSIYGLA